MPPLDDRMVGGLDAMIGIDMSGSEELVPETQQRVAALVSICNGGDRELSRQQHHKLDMEGGAASVTHGVGTSVKA